MVGLNDEVKALLAVLRGRFPGLEVATFVGEVIARSTTVDPALLEMLVANGSQQPQQIVFNPGYQQPRQLTITSPTGQIGQFRLGANGIEITDPNWGVRVD